MAAPAAASGARAAAGKAAGKKTAAAGSTSGLPERGDWRKRAQQDGGGKSRSGGAGAKLLKGDAGKYRRMMIAEFIVCAVLLGLSPLAKAPGEMGPVRFMKRGSATCALFVILGLLSSAGKGAAKAAAMFGALVTLVLLVDQREAFGKLAGILNVSEDDEAKDAADAEAGLGPDDSTTDDAPGSVQV